MYVRFHSPWAEVRRGVHYGLFGPAYDCARDPRVADVLRVAIWDEIDWFEEHLPAPLRGCFWMKSRKRWRNVGICWFLGEAREMISHAFTWLCCCASAACRWRKWRPTARARSCIATRGRSSPSRKRRRRRCGTEGSAVAR